MRDEEESTPPSQNVSGEEESAPLSQMVSGWSSTTRRKPKPPPPPDVNEWDHIGLIVLLVVVALIVLLGGLWAIGIIHGPRGAACVTDGHTVACATNE